MSRIFSAIPCIVLAALLTSGGAQAQRASDPHVLFEDKCLTCHGHAGPFARDRLLLGNTGLTTSGGLPLRAFLSRHMGGLTDPEIATLEILFRQNLTSGALFERTCRFCHDRAREFVRLNLILRDGRLTGRYSGRDVARFLPGHGRLTPEDARAMAEVLRRLAPAPE
ncbi:hypothetical protein [Roseovarius ramblicola]|uniref:Cytochrome c domain-containing protein n=1 Tax=Roseovarius ramblicola TaxID=2022336 RepID=A0ABV5I0L0_9RHOB